VTRERQAYARRPENAAAAPAYPQPMRLDLRSVRRPRTLAIAAGLALAALLAIGTVGSARLDTLAPVTAAEYTATLPAADRARLEAAVAFAADSDRTRSLVVWHAGEPVVEAHFHGQLGVAPQNLKSITKTLNSLLVGIAIDRGEIAGVDDPVARYLPERFAAARDPKARSITIRQLLTMSSGLDPVGYGTFQESADWSAALLDQPVVRKPGSEFLYDTPVTHLLSELVARVSGGDLVAYANRHLLEPIDAHIDTWRRGPGGVEMGGNDAYLRADHLAKLGELVRRGGVWNGERVISSRWLEQSLARQIEPADPTINHGTVPVGGYGFLWWRIELGGEPGGAALGHGGQYLIILPARELVIVVTSHWPGPSSVDHYRHLRRLFDEHLVPAFPRAAANADLPAGRP
jgi:CubicO group peptidase (beta-lactamase class C family)